MWTGSDDGLIHVSKDGGKSWNNVTPPDAGKWMMWNCIETDPFRKGTAFFAGTKYKLDDYTPYLFKTTDYGKTWTRITAGINNMHFTRAIRADRKVQGLLYAGTEFGMYISYNDGVSWRPFQLNLPVVPITDIALKDNDLIVATQGRSFWVIDDLTIVQQKTAEILDKKLHVFSVNESYRSEGGGRRRRGGAAAEPNAGANPPQGTVINFYAKGITDSSKLSITINDKQGKPIKTFSNYTKAPEDQIEVVDGMNQFVWDQNYPPAERADGMILWNGGVGSAKAAPGKYTGKIKFGNDSADFSFVIKPNPVYAATEADYDAQVSFLLSVRDKFNEVQKAIRNIRTVRTQINELNAKVDGRTHKEIKQLADSINKQITAVEEALYQTKAKSGQDVLNFPIRLNDKIAGLYGVASSGQNAPSKQVREVFADLSAQANLQLSKLKQVLDNDVKQLNKLINDKQVPVIGIK